MPASQIYQAEITLTDAQIKALPTTPVEIVPSVVDKVPVVLRAAFRPDFSAGAYTNIGANAALEVGGGGMGQIYNDSTDPGNQSFATGMLGFTTNSGYALAPSAIPNTSFGSWPVQLAFTSTALTVSCFNDDGNFTGGNAANTLKVIVLYVLLEI